MIDVNSTKEIYKYTIDTDKFINTYISEYVKGDINLKEKTGLYLQSNKEPIIISINDTEFDDKNIIPMKLVDEYFKFMGYNKEKNNNQKLKDNLITKGKIEFVQSESNFLIQLFFK